MTRSAYPFVALLALASTSPGSSPDSIESATKTVFGAARYANAAVAISITDPATSNVLFERNSNLSVMPASCMKVITSAAAYRYLGPDFRFLTRLLQRGQTGADGTAEQIVIDGGGDPTLGSNRVEDAINSPTLMKRWVEAIRAAGIKRVRNGILAADHSGPNGTLPPGGWEWDDLGNYYGAVPNALCYNDNLFYLKLHPGSRVGSAVSVVSTSPRLPGIEWQNELVTGPAGSGDQADIIGFPGTMTRRLVGSIPTGGEFTIKGSLLDSAGALAEAFRDALSSSGIVVSGDCRRVDKPPTDTSGVLAEIQSPRLSQIVHTLNKQSFNLYAEALLLEVGETARRQKCTSETTVRAAGIDVERKYFASVGAAIDDIQIQDGSGMARRNYVTAAGMTRVLGALRREAWFAQWQESLPVLGVDGDLRNRETTSTLKGKVRAKTGLITRVRGLCGYIETPKGKTLCFAMFANNYSGRWQDVDADFDRVLRAIYEAY